jgi:hypothetical protein
MILSQKILRFSLCFLILGTFTAQLDMRVAKAENDDAAIYEDNLTTTDGLRWAGPKLPYRKVVDIKDSLVNVPLGKVAADRFGVGSSINLADMIGGTFSHPVPGRAVYISLWGSKLEGCFVEMVVQSAPNSDTLDTDTISPKLLELGIGSQLIELPPQSSAQPKILNQNYKYYGADLKREYTGTWYMTRNAFVVDSKIATILSNAAGNEVRARLTLLDGRKILIPISKETVNSWKQAYSFNPACQSAESIAKQRQLSDQPLVGAFENYSGSAPQNEALDWLERKLDSKTFAQFGNQWRGTPLSSRGKPVRLVDAGKFYKKTRQQKAAVEWLQKKLPEDVLKEFVQKWN